MTTAAELKKLLKLRVRIDSLTRQFEGIAAGSRNGNGHVTKRQMSPEARARIIRAQKLRWSKWRKENRK